MALALELDCEQDRVLRFVQKAQVDGNIPHRLLDVDQGCSAYRLLRTT
jgi:hypothetical protein